MVNRVPTRRANRLYLGCLNTSLVWTLEELNQLPLIS